MSKRQKSDKARSMFQADYVRENRERLIENFGNRNSGSVEVDISIIHTELMWAYEAGYLAAARERDELREAAERLQNALDAPVEPYTVAHHTRRYDELRKARVGLRAALAHHDGSGEKHD